MNNSSPLLFPTSILLQCQCLTHQSNIHQLQNKTKIEDYCPIIICRILTRLTRRVSIVELELLTLPENRVHPRLLVGFVLLDLYFYMHVLQIVVCPFVLFLLASVLSVLLRYTDSDYPYGIFKLFLTLIYVEILL